MTRILLKILLLLIPAYSFAQNTLSGVVDGNEEGVMPGVEIKLAVKTGDTLKIFTDNEGKYEFDVPQMGGYTLVVNGFGYRTETYTTTVNTPETVLNIYYPKTCESKKLCPQGNHTKHIVPIVYGMPDKKMTRKANKGKIYLGGCTPYCEKWYCTEHKLSF